MPTFVSRPNSSLTYWVGNSYWSPTPTTSVPFHYTRIDEGIENKDEADYWRALATSPSERNAITVQSNAPADLDLGTELYFDVYWKSTKIVIEPGVRVIVYYNRHDVPSAAAGTNALNVYSTTGEFANAAVGDLFFNYTQTQRGRIFMVNSSNHIVLSFTGIAGQGPGDHVDYINNQHAKTFRINSSGQWKIYRLTMSTNTAITKAQLDDMEVSLVAVAGDGGEIPDEIQ